MKKAEFPLDEAERLQALLDYEVMDTISESSYDELTHLASAICDTPISLISLLDTNRQWFKSHHGLSATETPREFSFCGHAILEDDIFIVEDSSKDERFFDNPLVTGGPMVAFYAGIQLRSHTGYNIGTLCVIDQKPRKLTTVQIMTLKTLGKQVINQLELATTLRKEKIEKKLLRSILDIMPVSVFAKNIKDNYSFMIINKEFEKVFGLQASDMIGKNDYDLFPKDQADFFRRKDIKASASFDVIDIPEEQANLSHGIGLLHTSKIVIRDDDGNPSILLGICEDITTRKVMENKLKEDKDRLELVLSASGLGSWDWNLKTGVCFFDKIWCDQLGLDFKTVVNHSDTWASLVHPDDLSYCFAELEKHVKGVINEHNIKFRALHLDGSYRVIVAKGKIVDRDEDGNPTRFIGTHSDVTVQKELEDIISIQSAKLQASSKMASIGEMAAGVAHEINNPLAIISGRAGILIQYADSGKDVTSELLKSNMSKIMDATMRATKIINSLRSLSRDSTNDEMRFVSIDTLLANALYLCEEKLKQGSIDLKLLTVSNLEVKGRESQLGQVLINLLNNSYDAIIDTENPFIVVEITSSSTKLEISITDSGNGISKEIADKIMNPFFTTKEVGKGTGLGLSISKKIMLDHGGDLIIDSECKNTRFVMTLPK